MATIITHIYNEEQLLPLWLEHHSKYFEHGIVVDFASTDRSRDIIAEYPQFKIYDSTIDHFSAADLDKMMIEFERPVVGKRIVLNLTEFLIGNPERANRNLLIPSVSLVNMKFDEPFDWSRQFYEQRRYGISYEQNFKMRRSRVLSDELPDYPLGRHFETIDNDGFMIVHVANCFVSDGMYQRRLQIQHRIPQSDKNNLLGMQHYKVTNKRRGESFLTYEDLVILEKDIRKSAIDVSPFIDRALSIQ